MPSSSSADTATRCCIPGHGHKRVKARPCPRPRLLLHPCTALRARSGAADCGGPLVCAVQRVVIALHIYLLGGVACPCDAHPCLPPPFPLMGAPYHRDVCGRGVHDKGACGAVVHMTGRSAYGRDACDRACLSKVVPLHACPTSHVVRIPAPHITVMHTTPAEHGTKCAHGCGPRPNPPGVEPRAKAQWMGLSGCGEQCSGGTLHRMSTWHRRDPHSMVEQSLVWQLRALRVYQHMFCFYQAPR